MGTLAIFFKLAGLIPFSERIKLGAAMSRGFILLRLVMPLWLRALDLAERAAKVLQKNCVACHGAAD